MPINSSDSVDHFQKNSRIRPSRIPRISYTSIIKHKSYIFFLLISSHTWYTTPKPAHLGTPRKTTRVQPHYRYHFVFKLFGDTLSSSMRSNSCGYCWAPMNFIIQ